MQLVNIDGDADLTIHNISILPSDQCATEEQRTAKCCCGDDFFYDFPQQNWSHVVVYGFVYPMLVLTLIAPLSAVMLGMGKREQREGDRRYPNPLYQLISLLGFCAWISLLSPLPFTVWYYVVGDGLRSVNQSVVMCHLFRTTMEVIPHTVDTMISQFSILLAVARFLTQHARSALKLRTVERFSRAIWSIILSSCLLGTLRFFEHDTTTYTFCLDTEPLVSWAHRCMIRDGPLITFLGLGRPFWKAFLPLADLFLQFVVPGAILAMLHYGFSHDPVIDTGADKHNRFGRSMKDQTQIVIYAISIAFLVVQLPTLMITILSLATTHFGASRILSFFALAIGHLQPLFAVSAIVANCGGLLTAYYVIVKDDDLDVDHDQESNSSFDEAGADEYLLHRRSRGTYRNNYLSTSMSFDTASLSRRDSDYPVEHIFLHTPLYPSSPIQLIQPLQEKGMLESGGLRRQVPSPDDRISPTSRTSSRESKRMSVLPLNSRSGAHHQIRHIPLPVQKTSAIRSGSYNPSSSRKVSSPPKPPESAPPSSGGLTVGGPGIIRQYRSHSHTYRQQQQDQQKQQQ